MMKEIVFRPLRRVKKTGKVVVASYMQWRKVKTSDYNEFKLVVDNEYATFPPDEYVYDHKGEILFWFNHKNPEALPKNFVSIDDISRVLGIDKSELEGEAYKLTEPIGTGFHWSIHGFDCDGVPVFSHYSQSYVAKHFDNLEQFEPLTVGLVTKWFGWFIYQLENSRLQIGKR